MFTNSIKKQKLLNKNMGLYLAKAGTELKIMEVKK